MRRRYGVYSLVVLVCFFLWCGVASAREAKETDYSYYYEESLISLTPGKRLVAIEESVPNLMSVVREHKLEKDPLSEREALKNKSLGVYRIPAIRDKQTVVPDMRSVMTALSRSVTG
ncbi:MAG: hypothetical protein ACUBOA_03215 [Candidatus Loosdrechtia sp.]|uniref:hypothetical protein n=1 Tax=Candidatus Loosdrechtia sp. TaxID=3101272 RepID=UPI003A6C3773|nr:MAG: hypothetical protein QY305_05500 [Candidatus Jettenia sp. AMX2]